LLALALVGNPWPEPSVHGFFALNWLDVVYKIVGRINGALWYMHTDT